jgi:hypothetical protein
LLLKDLPDTEQQQQKEISIQSWFIDIKKNLKDNKTKI